MPTSSADIRTDSATRIIKRLCKHWGHKFPVEFDDHHGDITLPFGHCGLLAVDGVLQVRLASATAEQLDTFEPVVADHLARMAAEPLAIAWRRT